MPRFVILEHDHPDLHWDLMLETGDALQTWRLAAPPEPGRSVDATALADHRRIYLDYEGPVSGDRGTVKSWDDGMFTEGTDSTPGARALQMSGKRLRGRILLTQIDGTNWRLVFQSP